jgi:hypothetical protein
MKGKTGIVLAQMCRGNQVAEALIRQDCVPRGFLIGFGTKLGFLAFIEKSGTPYFQELARCMQTMADSSWQDVLEEVGKRVALMKIPYSEPGLPSGFLAKQEPVQHVNCPKKIPLKDEGMNLYAALKKVKLGL